MSETTKHQVKTTQVENAEQHSQLFKDIRNEDRHKYYVGYVAGFQVLKVKPEFFQAKKIKGEPEFFEKGQ